MVRNALLIASLLVAGCATGPEPEVDAREARAERIFVTGSNIPKRADAPADSVLPQAMGLTIIGRDSLQAIQSTGNGSDNTMTPARSGR
jgi:hypothetical protein